jgi:hypothetical protein
MCLVVQHDLIEYGICFVSREVVNIAGGVEALCESNRAPDNKIEYTGIETTVA